jgi:mannose-6-phosphate isomerase-like protein (cupin superfamily)
MQKINLAQKLSSFHDHWSPKIVGELNGQHVKLVKFQGEFVWHHHEAEDELFLVVRGRFRMDYKDAAGALQSVDIGEGEFVIVPRGAEHRPVAEQEVQVLLFEPAGTLNTGAAGGPRTVETLQHI